MKTIIKILIVSLLFYLAFSMPAQKQENAPGPEAQANRENQENSKNKIKEPNINVPGDDNQDMDDEDFPYSEDMLSRKVFQKRLTPLSKKEKIVWSFRLAETNSFL